MEITKTKISSKTEGVEESFFNYRETFTKLLIKICGAKYYNHEGNLRLKQEEFGQFGTFMNAKQIGTSHYLILSLNKACSSGWRE